MQWNLRNLLHSGREFAGTGEGLYCFAAAQQYSCDPKTNVECGCRKRPLVLLHFDLRDHSHCCGLFFAPTFPHLTEFVLPGAQES